MFKTISNTKEPYNSTNDWGFAGSIGYKYLFPESSDLYCLIAKTSHRHGGTSSPLSTNFIGIWNNGDHIFDKTYSKKNLEEAEEIIKNLIKENGNRSNN
jgi:hypothetical protein